MSEQTVINIVLEANMAPNGLKIIPYLRSAIKVEEIIVKASPHSQSLVFSPCVSRRRNWRFRFFTFIMRVKEKKLRNSDGRVKERKSVLSLWTVLSEMNKYNRGSTPADLSNP